MKINRSNPATATGSAQAGRGAARASGFSLGGPSASTETGAAAPAPTVSGVASLDALLALQSVEDPMQRRRRAVSRAGRILDALDGLKMGLLEGSVSAGSLQSLVAAVREERGATDDLRLQGLLNEIETRAAVELAKLGPALAA